MQVMWWQVSMQLSKYDKSIKLWMNYWVVLAAASLCVSVRKLEDVLESSRYQDDNSAQWMRFPLKPSSVLDSWETGALDSSGPHCAVPEHRHWPQILGTVEVWRFSRTTLVVFTGTVRCYFGRSSEEIRGDSRQSSAYYPPKYHNCLILQWYHAAKQVFVSPRLQKDLMMMLHRRARPWERWGRPKQALFKSRRGFWSSVLWFK